MFSRELLIELYRHMEWADSRIWAVIPPDGPPDARLQALLVHLHMVQHAFLAIWSGADLRALFRDPDDFPTAGALREWARSYYRNVHAHVAGISAERSSQIIRLPWSTQLTAEFGRPPGPTTLGETCFQVTSHSTYHRGQVNVRLRELGIEPPLVDYIAWLWFDRPDPVWPS